VDPATRRDFLRLTGLAVTAAGGLAFAGCGSDDPAAAGAADPKATPARDRAILNGALTLENTAVAAYGAGLPLLGTDAKRLGRRFLEQEREHARALAAAVRALGGRPNRPKPAAEYRAAFPRLRSEADVLRFATDLENVAISAYVEGIPKLSDPELRQSSAAILANEAEHVSLLLGERHPGRPEAAVPEAFVTGRAIK
jgi:bacterioferritin (cytochrome b1)